MLLDSAQSSIAAGETLNVFIGRPIEFIGVPSVARLLATADQGSLTANWVINVGGIQHVPIASGATVNAAVAPGQGPKEDEDMLATNVPLPAGSRNALLITNNGAGPAVFRYRLVILP
jgi:hypothetical protein